MSDVLLFKAFQGPKIKKSAGAFRLAECQKVQSYWFFATFKRMFPQYSRLNFSHSGLIGLVTSTCDLSFGIVLWCTCSCRGFIMGTKMPSSWGSLLPYCVLQDRSQIPLHYTEVYVSPDFSDDYFDDPPLPSAMESRRGTSNMAPIRDFSRTWMHR